MKNQKVIIAVVVLLILVVGGVALAMALRKTDSASTPRTLAMTNDPLRSGSLLDRVRAEQEAGMYGKKGGEEATA